MKHIGRHPTLTALLTAAITLSSVPATGKAAQPFLPDIIISSTIPANGDLNPYGVAIVPGGFPSGGTIAPGDVSLRRQCRQGSQETQPRSSKDRPSQDCRVSA
jgi:hypothetical protein